MSHYDIAPVIARKWQAEDSNANVLSTPFDSVSFVRGMGDSGRRVEAVDGISCPNCAEEYLIRLVHVNPERRNEANYWCLNPSCRYFVQDELSWAQTEYRPRTPKVWTQSARCVDCDERFTFEAHDELFDLSEYDTDDAGRPLMLCDDCQANRAELEVDV